MPSAKLQAVTSESTLMKDLRELDSLCGLILHSPFGPILDKLGAADDVSVSPPMPGDSVFATYSWNRRAPSIAVLTWRTADGEHVWGVRMFGAEGVAPELGFGVGASRDAVDTRCPGLGAQESDSIEIDLHKGALSIYFAGDRVRELQMRGPLSRD